MRTAWVLGDQLVPVHNAVLGLPGSKPVRDFAAYGASTIFSASRLS